MRSLQKIFPYAVLIVIGLLLLIPLYHRGFIVTDDGSWMIIRLSAFYQSFREGQFPVRFLGRLNHGYGYPVSNFLYPGYLYLGSFIHILGFQFVTTIKILLGVSLVSSGLWVYLWLKKFFKTVPSVIGALSFISAPYFLFDIYSRGSVGEVLALCVAAFGFYALESDYPWLFSIAVALLILAHNSLALLFVIVYLAYMIARKSLVTFFGWFLLGFAMSAFFWIPALYEQKYVVFPLIEVSNPAVYFILYKTLWLIGFASIVSLLLSIVGRVKKEMFVFFTVLLLSSLFLSTSFSSFIWQIRLVNSLFQFPFRMLSVTIFASAWLIACCVEVFRKYWIPIAILLIALSIIHIWVLYPPIQYEYQPDSYYRTNEATTTVKNEYMPRWVTAVPEQRASSRFEIDKGSATIVVNTMTTQYFDLSVHANETSVLQINTMYYPGWGVTVDDQLVPIDYKNEFGLIRVTVPSGDHRVIASFRETISRFVADVFAFASIVLFIVSTIVFIVSKKTKHRSRKTV